MLPIVLCIDVEPDPREVPVPATGGWLGFEALLERIDDVRGDLCRRSGSSVAFTWALRADPQIEVAYGSPSWGLDRYRSSLEAFVGAGDELALHPHSWRWDDQQRRWVSDQADPAWVEHCADTALRAYAEAFGRPCRAYRHGDRFWNARLYEFLEGAGITVDLSPEPGAPEVRGLAPGEATTGSLPHLPADRTGPWLPNGAGSSLVVLPLASGPTLPWAPVERFREGVERLLAAHTSHLAFAIRTDLPLIPEWAVFVQNMTWLADRLGRSARFVTASDARAWLSGEPPG